MATIFKKFKMLTKKQKNWLTHTMLVGISEKKSVNFIKTLNVKLEYDPAFSPEKQKFMFE
jgi:hypothetical protein